MTTIHSNGSRWAGEDPATIEELCAVMSTETLDPMFEKYGNFITMEGDSVHFFGNFYTVSHVFRIDCDEPETVKRIEDLIRANQQTPAYRKAKHERAEQERDQIKRRESNRRAVRAARGLSA